MELPLKCPAMTLILFQILALYTEKTFHLVPDADQVAPALKVSDFDCRSMTENSLYAINQVRLCHITPEELEVSKSTIALNTKHFRKELNGTKCRIQHQREKWHSGHLDHSIIDHTTSGRNSDLIISPEHRRALAKGASINLQGRSMTENSLYAINQVRLCHITPEELEVSKATITLYTKHFRKELNATKCRIQHQRERWHSGHLDHSIIDHTISGRNSDLIISPEHRRALAKGASINLQGHWIGAEWDTKTPVVKVSGDPTGSNRNHCKTEGWISRDIFIFHMQKNNTKSHDGKRKSVIRYGIDFTLCSRRSRLRNNFTRPICLYLGLP